MARVEMTLRRWADIQEAQPDEPCKSLVQTRIVVVDGEPIKDGRVKLVVDGFVRVEVLSPSAAMRARYSPEEYLMGTTDELLILPVTELIVS